MNLGTKHSHGNGVGWSWSLWDCREDTPPPRNADLSAMLLVPGLGNTLEKNYPLSPQNAAFQRNIYCKSMEEEIERFMPENLKSLECTVLKSFIVKN